MVLVKDLKDHKRVCEHRANRCGMQNYSFFKEHDDFHFLCNWEGTYNDIMGHCHEKHAGLVIELAEDRGDGAKGNYSNIFKLSDFQSKYNVGAFTMTFVGEIHFLLWTIITSSDEDEKGFNELQLRVTSFSKGGRKFTVTVDSTKYHSMFRSETVSANDHIENRPATQYFVVPHEQDNTDVSIKICFHVNLV